MGHAYTEKQAPLKWCPEARVAAIVEMSNGVMNAITVNRHHERRDPFEGAHCVASLCPHWQWVVGGRGAERKGYCGLSGKPDV